MDHAQHAEELFRSGCNCAQAVFCAVGDVTGMDFETAARLASSFGGGMGRLREVCGTVSGALMVLGLACGYSDVQDPEAKKAHYRLVREFAARFKEHNGTLICRELLEGVSVTPGGDPEERTDGYYKRRPCPGLVRDAASIVDAMLCEKQQPEEKQ